MACFSKYHPTQQGLVADESFGEYVAQIEFSSVGELTGCWVRCAVNELTSAYGMFAYPIRSI